MKYTVEFFEKCSIEDLEDMEEKMLESLYAIRALKDYKKVIRQ